MSESLSTATSPSLFSRVCAPFTAPLRKVWEAHYQPRWQQFWHARNRREQIILSVGAAILLGVCAYLLLWEPAAQSRDRLAKNLPQLRAQQAEMHSLAQEARGLSSTRASNLRGSALQEALQTSLAAKGLKAVRLNVQSGGAEGDSVQLQLSNVAFGAWADWLEEMRRQQQLKVVDAQIQYVGAPALVNLQATLQGPKP